MCCPVQPHASRLPQEGDGSKGFRNGSRKVNPTSLGPYTVANPIDSPAGLLSVFSRRITPAIRIDIQEHIELQDVSTIAPGEGDTGMPIPGEDFVDARVQSETTGTTEVQVEP